MSSHNRQRGSALVIALFMFTIVAALGVFAVKIGVHQEQTTSVQLLKARAHSAARAGLEIWAYRVAGGTNPNCPLPAALPVNVNIGTYRGLSGFAVQMTECTRIASGAAFIYELTFSARAGTFGTAGFVHQTVSRRISNIGPGSY